MTEGPDKRDVLSALHEFSPKERAAALAHYIYVWTTKQNKWPLRIAENWEDLKKGPREFNIAQVDAWARNPELLVAWIAAVNEYRRSLHGQLS